MYKCKRTELQWLYDRHCGSKDETEKNGESHKPFVIRLADAVNVNSPDSPGLLSTGFPKYKTTMLQKGNGCRLEHPMEFSPKLEKASILKCHDIIVDVQTSQLHWWRLRRHFNRQLLTSLQLPELHEMNVNQYTYCRVFLQLQNYTYHLLTVFFC